jgi:hypothetical protein
MRDDFKLILATIFMALWTGFLVGSTVAQEAHVGEQVVFKLDHRDSVDRYVMEAQDVRIAYTIEPIEGSHPAPLPDDALMLCRPYNEGPKLFLRCGMDRYAVRNVGLVPRKHKKEGNEE